MAQVLNQSMPDVLKEQQGGQSEWSKVKEGDFHRKQIRELLEGVEVWGSQRLRKDFGFYSVRWEASRRILAKERLDLDYF